jgi:hypothetical protein
MTHDDIDRIQRKWGCETRSALHNKVLDETGADEGEVDAAVLAYCRDENDANWNEYTGRLFRDVA